MDFRHLIVTCLFSMLRLSFETQKIKENYAILRKNSTFLHIIINTRYKHYTGPKQKTDRFYTILHFHFYFSSLQR